PQVLLHKKENGGKYTALNYAIEHATSELIGCLDADSFVDSEALIHMMPYFDNTEVAAVTPSLKIQNPDSILGMVQSAEYS
ncbi:glycosyltransferase, partial [Escherichia coli]|uniref:glycosyltransferase n=1 Tax=Escherichia coli TaxID=562 RepID=UPI0021E02CBD